MTKPSPSPAKKPKSVKAWAIVSDGIAITSISATEIEAWIRAARILNEDDVAGGITAMRKMGYRCIRVLISPL